MSEEKIMKTSAEIVINGQKKTIQKLRAGKFYDAQKIIAEMFRQAAQLSASSKSIESDKTPTSGNKSPDVDMGALLSLFEKLPTHVAKFVAICAEMSDEDLLKEAYPEEINKAFDICLELNNVMENLKNSVAPIETLGAVKSKN